MTDTPTPMPDADAVRAMLRAANLRGTAPRIAVLQFLHQTASPLTHAELAEALVPQGFDRTTVYRNLMTLSDAGLVSRFDLGDHVWRFELSRHPETQAADHPHFVCEQCGDVFCLHDTQVTITRPQQVAPTSLPEIHEILLKGRCVRCQ